jgi:hypothetical protein
MIVGQEDRCRTTLGGANIGGHESMMTPKDFQKKWDIGLELFPVFRGEVEGTIVPWQTDPNWIAALDRALETVPRHLLQKACVNTVIVVEGLEVGGRLAEAANSVYDPAWEPAGARPVHPRRISWVAIDRKLFDGPASEAFLRIPFLDSRVHEEIAHAWDFALEDRASRLCSNVSFPGSAWKSVAVLADGHLAPFAIPNRKSFKDGYTAEELSAEDWASAILWYVFRKDELLRTWSRPHHDFVEQLFQHERILA